MAYINQELKQKLAPGIKAALKKHGVSGTIGVEHYSCLVVRLKAGPFDFGHHHDVNHFHYSTMYTDPKLVAFLDDLIAAMKGDQWYDRSDIQTDYFDTAYYLRIKVGKYDKPYVITK